MILYFADRAMRIIGQASTMLPKGLLISDDFKAEDVDSGVKSFECDFVYKNRAKAEKMAEPGSYLLRSSDDEAEFYTIIDSELDTGKSTIKIYAEDAGMDLLNEIVSAYSASGAMTIAQYTSIFTADSGFEIGVNEVSTYTRRLSWEGESTVTERLLSLATQFDAELSFSFAIDKLKVTHKYINFWAKRGKDAGAVLRVGKHISGMRITKSVANIATALYVIGGTPTGANEPITLQGYSYDDGDIYVSGKYLMSRSALAKWSRYVNPDEQGTGLGHIVKRYSYDTTSQTELCSHAVTQLKKISEMEVNYEADVVDLPEGVKVGDTVRVVDEKGKLFLEARILKMETSVTRDERKITLGNYIIKSSGISEQMAELQRRVESISSGLTLYTWIAYADDEYGTGISLDPAEKPYVGMAANRLTETPDLTDPTVYTWQQTSGTAGKAGEDATLLKIDSSKGVLFKSNNFSTELTVTVYKGPITITNITALRSQFGSGAFLQWYWRKIDDNDWSVMSVSDSHISNDGFTLTITPADVDEKIVFKCDLEI